MRVASALMATLYGTAAFAGSPAEAWAAALADARRLSPAAAKYTRYLSAYHVPDAKARDELHKVVKQHLWAFSREADPGDLRKVTPDLWAFRLDEFGLDPLVYGRLTYVDPYFHVATTADGRQSVPGNPAPWLGDPAGVVELQQRVVSRTPVLRADWFWVQTVIQEGRGKVGEGTGYYDFLGVKTRDDYFKFVGYDPKLALQRKSVFAAIVQRRGPGVFPAQIFREGSVDGAVYQTKDVNDVADEQRDAIRHLGGDYKHQLEEWYGFGPSGLWAYALTNAAGVLQNRAPAAVLIDRTKVGSDVNIDNGLSCLRCHNTQGTGGLQPVVSYFHDTIGDARGTLEVSYEQAEEARQYTRDLNKFIKRDGERYTERLAECCGMTPRELGDAVIRIWDGYVEEGRDLAACARELGTTPERFGAALKAVAAQRKLDPALAPLIVNKTVRVEQWEKLYPAAQAMLLFKP